MFLFLFFVVLYTNKQIYTLFDGTKIECNYLASEWLNNDLLNFPLSLSEKTGEILQRTRISVINGLRFKIIPSIKHTNTTYCTIEGSIHKFHNNGNGNADNYTHTDVCKTIDFLEQKFNVQPENSTLRNLEIGINIKLPIKVSHFLKMLVSMPTKRFSELSLNSVKLGKVCQLGDKTLKIYDKGKQQKTDVQNLLRIELKYKRMRLLNEKYDIKTLADLKDIDKVKDLYKLLTDAFNDVIIYENNVNIDNFSTAKQARFYKYTNPLYWEHLDHKQRYKQIRQYETFLNEYAPQTIKKNVLYLMLEKWQKLVDSQHKKRGRFPQLENELQAEKKGTFSTLEYTRKTPPFTDKNIDKNFNQKLFEISEKTDHKKQTLKKRFCQSCGRDISEQKKGSKFCSEKTFGKSAKQCRNIASNITRNEKRTKLIEIENNNLIELTNKLCKTEYNLQIFRKTDKGIKQQRKKQKEVKPMQYKELRKIIKVKVFINRKAVAFTTMRAKELIKNIIIINIKNVQ